MSQNHIYIPSKGRPECITAKMLREYKYPAEWSIVLGSDDEAYGEYVAEHGVDKIIVFDKTEWTGKTDLCDAYSDQRPSGVAPARNFILAHAAERGEDRVWMFDDDYRGIYRCLYPSGKRELLKGDEMLRHFAAIDEYGRVADIPCVGFCQNSIANAGSSAWGHRTLVANGFNLSTKENDNVWKGRLFEDAYRSVRNASLGMPDMALNCYYIDLYYTYFVSERNQAGRMGTGGLVEAYSYGQEDDLYSANNVRLCGYTNMANPNAAKLVRNKKGYGRVVQTRRLTPKVLSEGWEKR